MPVIQTKGCQCALCSHIWIPNEWRRDANQPLPRWCPKCKSARWNEGSEQNNVATMPAPAVKAEVVREELVVDLQPKSRQSTGKAKPKHKEKKVTVKGLTRCSHGFSIVDGITLCSHCKTGK